MLDQNLKEYKRIHCRIFYIKPLFMIFYHELYVLSIFIYYIKGTLETFRAYKIEYRSL